MKDKHLIHFLLATGASVISETPMLGQITVANSALNYGGSFTETITGYLAGLPSDDETASLEALIPSVQTNDFFRFLKADDDGYLTEADDSDIRARGASFKRVQYKGTQVVDETAQKGLTMRVDHKDLPKANGAVIPGWENMYAMELRKRLLRADKYRGIAAIDAASTNVAITFSAATNPDGLLRAQVQLTRTATGRLPTHCVIGNASWQGRVDAYEAAARVNVGAVNHADYDEAALARYLRVGKVIIEDGMKQSAVGGAKTDQLGLVNYSYSAATSKIMGDPSNVFRAWSPVKGGGEWAVSIQEFDVYTDITVWHESKIVIPQTTGIRKTTVTIG
jgi:hypothetical protein